MNNWPSIIVQITRKVKKGERLWVYYDTGYSSIVEVQEFAEDAKNKMKRAIQEIC